MALSNDNLNWIPPNTPMSGTVGNPTLATRPDLLAGVHGHQNRPLAQLLENDEGLYADLATHAGLNIHLTPDERAGMPTGVDASDKLVKQSQLNAIPNALSSKFISDVSHSTIGGDNHYQWSGYNQILSLAMNGFSSPDPDFNYAKIREVMFYFQARLDDLNAEAVRVDYKYHPDDTWYPVIKDGPYLLVFNASFAGAHTGNVAHTVTLPVKDGQSAIDLRNLNRASGWHTYFQIMGVRQEG